MTKRVEHVISRNYSIKSDMSLSQRVNPREHILHCLLRSQQALRIYLRGSKISCAELHFVPVLRSLMRRASILAVESLFIKEIEFRLFTTSYVVNLYRGRGFLKNSK